MAALLWILGLFALIVIIAVIPGVNVSAMLLFAIAAIGFMFILFGPTVTKVYELVNFEFDMGDPILISVVVLVVLIFLLRKSDSQRYPR